MRSLALAAVVVAACSHPSQVSFVSNEQPGTQGRAEGDPPPNAANPNGGAASPNGELPNDEQVIEPDHPFADTKPQRATVHIHAPEGRPCSGVMLTNDIVATAQRCFRAEKKGVTLLPAAREVRVEVPSSSLTWTNRRAKYVILPACEANDFDIALLVLSEPAAWVQPLRVISAPNVGAKVQALGFGTCEGAKGPKKERNGLVRSRVSDAVVIDVPLCRGDAGGPVVDGPEGDLIGLISRRDDPEGSPLRTTTIVRIDTPPARELLEQAKGLASGGDAAKATAVACR